MEVSFMWTIINFGKYREKTLPQVMFSDPDWFFWAWENAVFDKRETLKRQAQDIYNKSRNIKIPESCGIDMEVEYYIHHPKGKFSHFKIVPRNQSAHVGSSPAFRSSIIDMRVPRDVSSYDKLGCRNLLDSLKFYVFGKENARMTKDRCERFFNDSNNFT